MEFLLNKFKEVFENTFPNTVKYTYKSDGSVILQFENMPSDFHSMLKRLYYLDNGAKVYFYKLDDKVRTIEINEDNFGRILDALTTPCRDYALKKGFN